MICSVWWTYLVENVASAQVVSAYPGKGTNGYREYIDSL